MHQQLLVLMLIRKENDDKPVESAVGPDTNKEYHDEPLGSADGPDANKETDENCDGEFNIGDIVNDSGGASDEEDGNGKEDVRISLMSVQDSMISNDTRHLSSRSCFMC